MSAPLTSLYAGLLVLLLLVLAGRVSLLRIKLHVGTGHGNDPELGRAIRVHGNAVEWILPMLVVFLVAELDGASRVFLHICGVTFFVSRIVHAVALSQTTKESRGRFWGMTGTWIVIVVLSLWDIWAMTRLGLRFLI